MKKGRIDLTMSLNVRIHCEQCMEDTITRRTQTRQLRTFGGNVGAYTVGAVVSREIVRIFDI